MATPTTQPTKAVASMMPSMPMLTTPDRSHSTPHRAARAMGVAARRMIGRDRRQQLDDVADELRDESQDGDVVDGVEVHQGTLPRWHTSV